MLLKPNQTCWRLERADRVSVLVENDAYFATLKEALCNARRTVRILGWQFDPRTRLDPESPVHEHSEEVGLLLRRLVRDNPELDVQLLIWKSPLPIAVSQGFYPHKAQRWFRRRTVDFRLDRPRPLGASHHQKVVVIDDRLAFCGGGDISTDRWDTLQHRDGDPRRCTPSGLICQPRHEVTMMLDGDAAGALTDLFRERWWRATGERIERVEVAEDPWPQTVEPDVTGVNVGVARTEPAWRGRSGVRENELLHLEAIARARRLIYLENQYFTSPLIGAALADRLDDEDGPEVVLVSTGLAPSWFDHATMDSARAALLERLREADRFGRFTAWRPQTRRGKPIIVHSKVTVIDDRFLRVGSTNLNNRSTGFDTECDVAFETDDPNDAAAAFIQGLRRRLIAHFLDADAEAYGHVEAVAPSVGAAIEAMNEKRRMAVLSPGPASWWARFIAEYQLGDPVTPGDSLRPWRRRRMSDLLRHEVAEAQALIASDAAAGSSSKSITSGR